MKKNEIKKCVSLVEVASTIKQRIIDGTYPRSSKLPTREKLKLELKTTYATIQRGFDKLIADGYVYTNGSRGTFVVEFPPVEYHYGILFLHVTGDEAWVKYWERMQEEAEKWNENTNYTFKF
jgi:DNA-binding FadR family transcriptional regulator